MMFFGALSAIGIVLNILLYIDDLKNRGGILDSVDPEKKLAELMTSPEQGGKRRAHGDAEDEDYDMNVDDNVKASLEVYKQNKETRDNLKRSIAKQSMSNN